MEGARFLTVSEVAAELRVSEETVRRWLRTKRLRGVQLGGGHSGYRIERAELERFLEAVA